jgi:hypothetical protein
MTNIHLLLETKLKLIFRRLYSWLDKNDGSKPLKIRGKIRPSGLRTYLICRNTRIGICAMRTRTYMRAYAGKRIRMRMCTYAYPYTYIAIRMRTYAYLYMYNSIGMCTYAYRYTYAYLYTYVFLYAYVYVCVSV